MHVKTLSYFNDTGWSNELPTLTQDNLLILVFGAPCMADKTEPLQALRAHYPNATIAGCSSAGEIFNTELNDNSLAVAIIGFESTQIKSIAVPQSNAEKSFTAGQSIMEALADDDLKGVLVLSEGLTVNGSQLIAGINSMRAPSVVVTGGLAGDGDAFGKTWVLVDDKAESGYATAIGFYGDAIQIGHGSKGGWDSFGPERTVTRSKDNVLYELDSKPALSLYKDYLGELAKELPASALRFPLTIKGSDKTLVRTILAIDEDEQSMTFAGDIPTNATVQLMRANMDHLVTGAEDAATMTTRNMELSNSDVLSIAISCVGRRIVLGQFTEDEIEATMDVLPKNTQQVGFYSYGELSPYADGDCDLHNQTMTLTTLYEH